MPDVNVFLVDFRVPGREMVVPNEDGSYTILINAKLSQDGQIMAYQHAMNHISGGDFEKSDVQIIEATAHGSDTPEKTAPISADKYEKRIMRLKRERKKIQKALKEKEAEISMIAELFGPDCFVRAAEYSWLYGEPE